MGQGTYRLDKDPKHHPRHHQKCGGGVPKFIIFDFLALSTGPSCLKHFYLNSIT